MANRITDHNDPAYAHAVKCVPCGRFHGPLYICPHYDGEDIDEVNRKRHTYKELCDNGEAGLLGRLFPPQPPIQNWRHN